MTSARAFPLTLAALFALSVALALAWSLRLPTDRAALAALPDQLEYLALADALRDDGELAFVDPRFGGDPAVAFRMPAYPALLALLHSDVRAARVAQAFLHGTTAVAAALLTRRWLDTRRSLFAGTLVALNPFLVFAAGAVLTDTLFVTVVTLAAAALAHGRPPTVVGFRPARALWWTGALLLALATLVRPAGLPWCATLGAMSLLAQRGRAPRATRVPVPLVLGLLTLAALLPWAARNRAATGHWVWLTTNDGLTLYDGLRPGATGASDQRWTRELPQLSAMSEWQRHDYLTRRARALARDDPARVAALAARKVARTWSPVPLSDAHATRANVVVAALYTVPLFALALWGTFVGSRLRPGPRAFLLTPAVLVTLGAAVTVGSLRYRLPADPALAALAASAAPRRARLRAAP